MAGVTNTHVVFTYRPQMPKGEDTTPRNCWNNIYPICIALAIALAKSYPTGKRQWGTGRTPTGAWDLTHITSTQMHFKLRCIPIEFASVTNTISCHAIMLSNSTSAIVAPTTDQPHSSTLVLAITPWLGRCTIITIRTIATNITNTKFNGEPSLS